MPIRNTLHELFYYVGIIVPNQDVTAMDIGIKNHYQDENYIGAYDVIISTHNICVYHSLSYIEDFDVPIIVQKLLRRGVENPDIIIMSSTDNLPRNRPVVDHHILISGLNTDREGDLRIFMDNIHEVNYHNIELYQYLKKDLNLYRPLRLEGGVAPPDEMFAHRNVNINIDG